MEILKFKITKRKILSILTLGIFLGLLMFLYNRKHERIAEQIEHEYQSLDSSSVIKGYEVKQTYFPEGWRGEKYARYVTFNNGTKIQICVDEFLNDKKEDIRPLLKPGSKVYKNANNDSLIIEKNDRKHYIKIDTYENND